MPKYKLTNGNTIVAEQAFVEANYPGQWTLIVEEVTQQKPKLTHRTFLKRLTATEFKAIRQAAKNDADVDMFMYLFERSQEIDLNDPDTVSGVQMLEAKSLLAAGRAAEILA